VKLKTSTVTEPCKAAKPCPGIRTSSTVIRHYLMCLTNRS
jgi:hypothetical protein